MKKREIKDTYFRILDEICSPIFKNMDADFLDSSTSFLYFKLFPYDSALDLLYDLINISISLLEKSNKTISSADIIKFWNGKFNCNTDELQKLQNKLADLLTEVKSNISSDGMYMALDIFYKGFPIYRKYLKYTDAELFSSIKKELNKERSQKANNIKNQNNQKFQSAIKELYKNECSKNIKLSKYKFSNTFISEVKQIANKLNYPWNPSDKPLSIRKILSKK